VQVNKTTLITLRALLKSGIVVLVLGMMALTPVKWVKSRLTDGVTVSVPDKLLPMSVEDMAQRFPSVRAPLGAFTNADRVIDFSINISATNWPDGDTELARKFFKSSLQNLYDRVDFIGEGVISIHKAKYIFFEFESRISGDRRREGMSDPILKYTYIQYHIQKERTLVFTFSCPKDQEEEWKPIAHEMMKRIRVN